MWQVAVVVCVGWVASLCLHEFGHAIVAYWGGDKSVKEKGYLTLNPLKYTEPGVSLILPLFFLLIGGIALPGGAVYIDRAQLRHRWWHSAVSAAGPFANIILLLLLAIPFQLGWTVGRDDWLGYSVAFLVLLEIFVVLINLLPIPPLDGYGIISPWLPPHLQRQFNKFGKYGIWVLIGLLWFVEPFNRLLWDCTFAISNSLSVPPIAALMGGELFRKNSMILVIGLVGIMWLFGNKERRWYDKGNSWMGVKRYQRALNCYNKALEIKPDYYEAVLAKAWVLSQTERTAEALEAYDKAIQLQGNRPVAWYQKGALLAEQHRDAEAIEAYDRAVELQPNWGVAWFCRGIVLMKSERYEDAIASFEKARKYDSKTEQTAYAWYYQGSSLAGLKKYEKAIEAYDRAIQLQPNTEIFWLFRGDALSSLNRHEERLASYEEALCLKPDNHLIWVRKGDALCQLQRHEESLAAYDRAIELQPNFPLASARRGIALMELQRYDDAIATYNYALQIEPDDPDTWYNKACCYAQQEEVYSAIESLQQAIDFNPKKFRNAARTDSDFDEIREHPLFQKLIPSRSDRT
ncbi:tetratricopeptide repeat protein [Lusitaniella coriacea]|uniref:tetratricopeptide repeat protein n=1 Tax=Lusitaniella coriacea TaxID=1983105 RepID=UPI003CE9BB7F